MLRSLIHKRLLVSALALAAFLAVHGAAGAYPADDYTGDYSEWWWIYANPAARVVQPAVEAEPVARGGATASFQTALPGDEPCGNEIRKIPVPVPGEEPYPIEDQLAACGL